MNIRFETSACTDTIASIQIQYSVRLSTIQQFIHIPKTLFTFRLRNDTPASIASIQREYSIQTIQCKFYIAQLLKYFSITFNNNSLCIHPRLFKFNLYNNKTDSVSACSNNISSSMLQYNIFINESISVQFSNPFVNSRIT